MIREGARGRALFRALALSCLSALAFTLSFTGFPALARADPQLEWRTVRTPHFAVHYHRGLEKIAQRTASLAESIRERLAGPMSLPPGHITHVLVTDNVDTANGSATAIPYNAIRLFASAPEEMSVLGDYDDWGLSLVTHEQTHIFHVDNISGPAVVLNAVLGKTYSPNQVQPRWILEGLATALESRLTGGGRLRSPLFDMYLRADVLEDNVATLDQMSHTLRRWPGGDIWYLYGGKFIGFILETYGDDVFGAVATDYGSNIFPWGLNRSIRRATGRTYPELYEAWVASLRAKYGGEVASVKARGLRVGTQLTHAGQIASNPRFLPRCARKGPREELLYHKDDGHVPGGLYRLPLESRSRADEDSIELVTKVAGSPRTASFDGECGAVFDSAAPSDRGYGFDDLHRFSMAARPAEGDLRGRVRLTTGLRARSPDVSPDGRHVVFVTNHAGTTTLRIAALAPRAVLGAPRRLVESSAGDQVFTPRFSPDGRKVAFGSWTKGGYRDIRIVDVESGAVAELMHDRAVDTQPSWSSDGRYLFFSSDRTGIPNVHAYELATGALHQVTNVLTGAFMPEPSPDGRTLVYVGYSSKGFDLFSLPLSEERFLPALPPGDDRPEVHPEPPPKKWPVTRYDPLPTLRPHAYEAAYATGLFGRTLTLRTSGSDIVGLHSIFGAVTLYEDVRSVPWSVSYSYNPLPLRFSASAFFAVAPRTPVAVEGKPVKWNEGIHGVTTAVGWSFPDEFEGQNVNLSYTASAHSMSEFPAPRAQDPYEYLSPAPNDFYLGSVRVAWDYSNAFRSAYAISAERGITVGVSGEYAGTETGSQATLSSIDVRAIGYAMAPWGMHHAFALALSGGAAVGSYPGRGYYVSGGYADLDPYDSVLNQLRQNPFVLRGYPPGAFGGRQYNLANFEYRFPVAWPDRGVSTLPVFLNSVYGAVFADYGGAYDQLDLDDPLEQYRLGVGADIRVRFTVGYFLDSGLRFGYARGFSKGHIPGGQTYVVASASF